jgi:hypothetical protein
MSETTVPHTCVETRNLDHRGYQPHSTTGIGPNYPGERRSIHFSKGRPFVPANESLSPRQTQHIRPSIDRLFRPGKSIASPPEYLLLTIAKGQVIQGSITWV